MQPERNPVDQWYCITEMLYQSANSTLYRAHSHDSEADVVIKCFEPDSTESYLREMAGFGISHPNLVSYLDTFYINQQYPCIVFKWYPMTLEKWLTEHGQADEAFVYRCCEDILQAIRYLNQHSWIHCDIKPQNVFLELEDGVVTQFVLGDLGSTCSVQEAQESRYTVSTPAYLAPERVYKNFYLNSDLYSLGVMCYELLVGSRPFVGTPDELTKAHLSKQPPLDNIKQLVLRDFIAQLLEKKPTLRINNAEIALYILKHLQGQEASVIQEDFHRPVISTPQPIIPFGFFEKRHLKANFPANKVMTFPIGEQLIVLFEYDNYFELSYGGEKSWLCIKNGAVQTVDDESFVYLNGNKLIRYDLKNNEQQCLYRFQDSVDYFLYSYGYLLSNNKYRSNYLNIQVRQEAHFSQPHYMADSYTTIFEDGGFCHASGSCNQEVVWRDSDTRILGQWQLEGPVIGITHAKNIALVLTLDMINDSKYLLWAIQPDEKAHKVILPDNVKLHCQTQGYFFLLTACNQLLMCGTDLNVLALANLPNIGQNIKAFHLTIDHRWLTVLAGDQGQGSIVHCYQTYGT